MNVLEGHGTGTVSTGSAKGSGVAELEDSSEDSDDELPTFSTGLSLDNDELSELLSLLALDALDDESLDALEDDSLDDEEASLDAVEDDSLDEDAVSLEEDDEMSGVSARVTTYPSGIMRIAGETDVLYVN